MKDSISERGSIPIHGRPGWADSLDCEVRQDVKVSRSPVVLISIRWTIGDGQLVGARRELDRVRSRAGGAPSDSGVDVRRADGLPQ